MASAFRRKNFEGGGRKAIALLYSSGSTTILSQDHVNWNHGMTRRIHPVILGGSLVAVLDILAAFALRGVLGTPPLRVLQAIASGLLGPAAFQGGTATAALGMFLHVVIAFVVAAVYYAVSRWWSVLVRAPIPCGLAYGTAVYLVMNEVVLPLSRVAVRTPPWYVVVSMLAIHMLFVGLPVAVAVARADEPRRKTARVGALTG